MKIKKIANSVGLVANVTNEHSESKQDSYSCEYVNKLHGTKLWVNPDMTVSFESQNITLDSSDYDELLWFFATDVVIEGTTKNIIHAISLKNFGTRVVYFSDTNFKYWHRTINCVDDATYTITDCKLITSSDSSVSNTNLIPICILGVKNSELTGITEEVE